MTYYKLSSRTINLVFTIGGSLAASAAMTSGFGSAVGRGFLSGSIDHPLVSATWSVEAIHFMPGGTTTTDRALTLSCFGVSDSYSDSLTTIDGDAAGTLEVSVACDVCLATDNPQTGTGDLAPFFGRIEDTPANTRVHLYLVPQPDQDVVATLTIGDMVLSVTGNTGADPAPLGYPTTMAMTAEAGGTISFLTSGSPAASGSADGSISMGGWPASSYAGKSCTSSVAHSSTSASTTSGGVNISAEAAVSGPVGDFDFVNGATAEAATSREESGDRTAKLDCAVFHMLFAPGSIGMYSDELTANLTGFAVATKDFTGSFTETITQKQCDQSVSGTSAESIEEVFDTDSCSDSDNADTYSPLAVTLDSASLAANGDDPNATRLLIRGKNWLAATLKQDTDKLVDECVALSVTSGDWQGDWSISGSGSVSIASSAYVQFSGSGETLSRSFDPKGYFAGYRWLWLRVRADASSKTLTVAINGKEWDITTSATVNAWTNCWIDLCLPPNRTATEDGTNTRWPEDADGYPTEGADYFGIGSTAGIDITGMESGVVYQLDYIKLSCGDISAYGVNSPSYGYTDTDTIPSLAPWWSEKPDVEVSESGTTTSFYVRRFLHALVEEVGQGIDEPAFKKQVTVGGVTGVTVVVYTHVSILALLTRLNHRRYPGVTATDLVPMPTPSGDTHPPASDEYFNSDLPAVYLGGGGLLAQNAPFGSIDPNDWFRASSAMDHIGGWVASTWTEAVLNLNAQPLYDSVGEWFAGVGDVFEHRNTGATDTGELLLRAGTMLRPYGRGIVADSNHDPKDAVVVTLFQGGNNRGSGESETGSGGQGEYFTLSPFAKTPVTSSLETSNRAVDFTAYTRLRQRSVFVEPAAGEWLSADTSPSGRMARAYVEDGNIWVGFCGVPSGASWSAIDCGFAGATPSVRYDPVTARLVLSYEDSGSIKTRYTDDEGGTWSVATTIGSGTHPEVVVTPTGVRHHFWVSGGAIKRESLDSQGNTVNAEASVLASGAAADAIAATLGTTSGTVYLQYRDGSGNIVVLTSTDGAVTFS